MSTPETTSAPAAPVELVAIDVDGTLLTSDKRLSQRAISAVAAVLGRGVPVVLASARPPRTVREIYEHLGLDTPQINYNGALIHDPTRGRHVFHQPLDAALAKRIARFARRVDRNVVVNVEILDRWYTDRVDVELLTETSRMFNPDFIGELDAFLHVPVTKLMLLAPAERLAKVRDAVHKKFAGQITILVSDDHLIQIVHPEVSKGAALAQVAQEYGVAGQNVMAIGDAPNDVSMLRFAGLGVAVANAWDAARDAADVVVPSNDEDGVVYALRRFVLDRV